MLDGTLDTPLQTRTRPITEPEGQVQMLQALRSLGVLKANEQTSAMHDHGCAAMSNGACTCVGGPELIWCDFDEVKPYRHFFIPKRFNHEHHTA